MTIYWTLLRSEVFNVGKGCKCFSIDKLHQMEGSSLSKWAGCPSCHLHLFHNWLYWEPSNGQGDLVFAAYCFCYAENILTGQGLLSCGILVCSGGYYIWFLFIVGRMVCLLDSGAQMVINMPDNKKKLVVLSLKSCKIFMEMWILL